MAKRAGIFFWTKALIYEQITRRGMLWTVAFFHGVLGTSEENASCMIVLGLTEPELWEIGVVFNDI